MTQFTQAWRRYEPHIARNLENPSIYRKWNNPQKKSHKPKFFNCLPRQAFAAKSKSVYFAINSNPRDINTPIQLAYTQFLRFGVILQSYITELASQMLFLNNLSNLLATCVVHQNEFYSPESPKTSCFLMITNRPGFQDRVPW